MDRLKACFDLLHGHPTRWSTYVGKRVPEIKDITSDFIWHHVASEDNPADILSRGTNPEELRHKSMVERIILVGKR